jgi:G3E family GTPase
LNSDNSKKYGLVVNDVASINVDSKLIRQQTMSKDRDGVDTIELQNGCVCCSLAEDLVISIAKLVTISDAKQERYDHIVVECSGIAEPRKMRELFQEAEDYDSPMLYNIKLDTLITIVDAKMFFDTFGSTVNINSKVDLAYRPDDVDGRKSLSGGSGERLVTELLLEQVECADVVLINKCDLLERAEDVQLVERVIFKMNPNAKVMTCTNGEIANPTEILGIAQGEGAASWGILDEHRKMVAAVEKEMAKDCKDADCKDPTHQHDHSHEHNSECADVTCNDPTHDHGHSHEHSSACQDVTCNDPTHNHDHSNEMHSSAVACQDSTCKDPTHNHDHNHNHMQTSTAVCHDSSCKDPTHDHGHSHEHSSSAACQDVTCNDPTHNHDHSHSHSHISTTTAEERFGIKSFIYKRRKPFHPIRLSKFLQSIGKLSVKGVTDLGVTSSAMEGNAQDADTNSNILSPTRKALLRSKGFVWMASSKSTVYFWSHAGQYVELLLLGRWWADINQEEWPPGMSEEIMLDFDGKQGDRRQELVFIGQFSESTGNTIAALESVLDACLLTDEEMAVYTATANKGDEALRNVYFQSKARSDFDSYVDQLEKPQK